MKKQIILLLILSYFTFAKINTVATIPDIGDMIQQIGKDKVNLFVLATGQEDLHAVPYRPSFLPKLNRADLLFSLGLDAEHAWLPKLVRNSRNNKIDPNSENWIEVYYGINILNIPDKVSRVEGEQHILGNPHFNLSPQNGIYMVDNILNALINYDPKNENFYKSNAKVYKDKITSLIKKHKKKNNYSTIPVVSYHEDINYFSQFYNLDLIGTIEYRPGIPPTAKHLIHLEGLAIKKKVKLVIFNTTQPKKMCINFAQKIGAKCLVIALSVGAVPEATSWLELMEYNFNKLVNAL